MTTQVTGNPGSVTVRSKITVFVWGKNMILKLVGILNKG